MAPLQELFETHAIVKILDFLTVFKDFEYTKTDIAKETEISRRTLYEVFPVLEKYELVKNTRSFGAIKYYKLNSENSIVRLLIRLADEIALFNAEKETGIKLTSDIDIDIQRVTNNCSVSTEPTIRLTKTMITVEGTASDVNKLMQGKMNILDGVTSFPSNDFTSNRCIQEVMKKIP